MRTLFILLAIFALPASLFSATIEVPGQFPTIQGAINASVDGDTVLVSPGTYVENIDFKGKAITVRSLSGPEATIIDGGNPADPNFGSVVIFQNGEGAGSLLDGFTITNGTGTWYAIISGYIGGGICCWKDSSPTIINNIISMNFSDGGGGIACRDGSPTISDNLISQNTAAYGGGMSCTGCSAVMKGNTIADNTADFCGGGVWLSEGDTSTVTSNIISDNSVTQSGNHWGGGGISIVYQSTSIITNCILSGNSSAGAGGAITLGDEANATITNSTIFENTAEFGGGVYCHSSDPTITNTILWNNYAPVVCEMMILSEDYPSSLAISYSDVKGGKTSCFVDIACTLNWGPGMITTNPLFVDPAGGDFHLTYPSPCRNTGDNSAVTESNDFEGDPRMAYGAVDMGADEFHPHLYYTGNATPGGTVELKFIDLPGASPVGFWIAFNVLDTPLPGAYGDWWLLPPMLGPISLGSIPSNGVYVLPGTLPGSLPGPYTLYLQAIMGTPLKLTNLCTMRVE